MPISTATATMSGVPAPDAVATARRMVGEAVGELMAFWNFKPSMGRVWTSLYLSPRPLTAPEIVMETGLSVGSVSMTLQDLKRWRVVREVGRSAGRRCYMAETDIVSMVSRVFREREMILVHRSMERFETAVRLLDEHGRSSVPSQMLDSRFVATRARRLLDLSKAGHAMMDRFSRIGRLDLGTIRDKLSRRI